jgi:hypothetical protein
MSTGRPPKYKTVKELQEKIDQYFEEKVGVDIIKDAEGNICTDKKGNTIYEVRPPTISGLALYLGFESRQSLYDYKKRDAFSYTIKQTTLKIEEFAESQLFVGNTTGAIFWLKNKGWKDKTEQDLTVKGPVKIKVRHTSEDVKD